MRILLCTGLMAALAVGAQPTELMWRNPGRVESLDFTGGPGGRTMAPRGPYTFVEEVLSGTSAKVLVRDARNREWVVKWGPEAKPEPFAIRMIWATGFYAQPTWFVARGNIRGCERSSLKRASEFLDDRGDFRDARFQKGYDRAAQPMKGNNWALVNNPFIGKPEFSGIRIMAMLLSNRDLKDARSTDGINTDIFEVKYRDQRQLFYAVSDWGTALGKWGAAKNYSRWDCKGYTDQTPDFVKGVGPDGFVNFGYSGKFDEDIVKGITVADVRWLMQYLGRITDRQIQAGLTASGATPEESTCFAGSVTARIEQLRRVARPSTSVSGTASRYRQSARDRLQ